MSTAETSRRWWHSHEWIVLLLAVTILGFALGWLAWQFSLTSHRRATRQQIEARGAHIEMLPVVSSNRFVPLRESDDNYTVNRVRRWLGDEPVKLIYFSDPLTAADREAIEAFPEADVEVPRWKVPGRQASPP